LPNAQSHHSFNAEEKTMPGMPNETEGQMPLTSDAPSVEFIHAISEFFDTDPQDLLVELGYYNRDEDVTSLLSDIAEKQE
jgi:hypothetical protein